MLQREWRHDEDELVDFEIDFKCHLTPLAFWTGKLSITQEITKYNKCWREEYQEKTTNFLVLSIYRLNLRDHGHHHRTQHWWLNKIGWPIQWLALMARRRPQSHKRPRKQLKMKQMTWRELQTDPLLIIRPTLTAIILIFFYDRPSRLEKFSLRRRFYLSLTRRPSVAAAVHLG